MECLVLQFEITPEILFYIIIHIPNILFSQLKSKITIIICLNCVKNYKSVNASRYNIRKRAVLETQLNKNYSKVGVIFI